MDAYICDGIRTPFGRYGGDLATIRADDLGSLPIRALMDRNKLLDWSQIDDVIYGCANQAGEDNRNVARMSALLAGLPVNVGGTTINRLCGSGMDAISMAARTIKSGEANLLIAGGVESMSRAPFIVPKTYSPFSRSISIEDTTIGWRLINDKMNVLYGTHSMPETAENVAEQFNVSRADQDAFALQSQLRAQRAVEQGIFDQEIIPVTVSQKRGDPVCIKRDQHPRSDMKIEQLEKLKPIVKANGSVTAGNASGVNDGACALLIASEAICREKSLTPIAKIVATTASGVLPEVMGIGPISATKKLMSMTGLSCGQMEVIELNEAFAAQAIAVLRSLDLPIDGEHINPNGGAIALGHPLGASGARLVMTAAYELQRRKGKYALCTMCVGVGQGIAMLLERV